MIKGISLPVGWPGVTDVPFERTDRQLYSVGVGNYDDAMKVVRHGEHDDGYPFSLSGQMVGR